MTGSVKYWAMERKYSLERYKGMRTRHRCPECGKKGVFVRYVDTSTGEYLSDEVGRCNREDKCGYHYTPKQYFADHPELVRSRQDPKITTRCERGNRGGSVQRCRVWDTDATGRASQRGCGSVNLVPNYGTIPVEYLNRSKGEKSDFVRFLHSLFDGDSVARTVEAYRLGCTRKGAVIYWQVDLNGEVRTGKIMRYDPVTGKRVKDGRSITWAHSELKRQGLLPESWELSQCLFGEHLLRLRPSDTVCLVEGEKSAVIGTIVMPEYVWLATGGKQNLKPEKCRCLIGRRVIVFPDLGAFNLWSEKASVLAGAGVSVEVSDLLERVADGADRVEGLDIADYIIRQFNNDRL